MSFEGKNGENIKKINDNFSGNMNGETKISWDFNLDGLFRRSDAIYENGKKTRYSTTRRMDKGVGTSVTNFYWDEDDLKIVDKIFPRLDDNMYNQYAAGDGNVIPNKSTPKKRSKVKRFINKLLRRRSSEPILKTVIEKSFDKDENSEKVIDLVLNPNAPIKTTIRKQFRGMYEVYDKESENKNISPYEQDSN
jgi:hypothetical protein